MKTILFILFLLCIKFFAYCQEKIVIDYDDAGNRILRYYDAGLKSAKITSGMEEEKIIETIGEMEITIYPNPFEDRIRIIAEHIPDNLNGSEISVYDLKGSLLKQINQLGRENILDLETSPKGVYVLRVRINEDVSEWKIVKQ